LAQPDTLVIAESTRRQIGALFDIEDPGPQRLAGFAEPQHAWRVIGESGGPEPFRGVARRRRRSSGGDEDLDLLLRRWEQAKVGEGRVVLLSGEPGIGKARLTAALSEAVAAEPHSSSTRWFRTPPTAHCCGADDKNCTAA
jgi:hypothetical protein